MREDPTAERRRSIAQPRSEAEIRRARRDPYIAQHESIVDAAMRRELEEELRNHPDEYGERR
jgi:hypothetical protein